MTRDDIIRLFEKANGWNPKGFENTLEDLERFAALVVAHEREKRKWVGLTKAERSELWDSMDWGGMPEHEYGKAIEAKLKERNT